jgi:site-specific recombinase XerD
MTTLPHYSELVTIEEAVPVFVDDLDLADTTKNTYSWALRVLIEFMHVTYGHKDGTRLEDISVDLLADFSRWLKERYKKRTVHIYLTAARRLMEWLDARDLLPEGTFFDRMARRIDGARGHRHSGYEQRKVDPDAFKVLEYWTNMELPKTKSRRLSILRNRALIMFLYDTAARISEALALTREDVMDGRADRVMLTNTKNGKPRTVFLHEETRQLLQEYTGERTDKSHAPLFASHGRGKGTAITPQHAWLVIKQAAEALGMYATSPHCLRHQRAQELFNEGMPLEWLQAMLGHVSPETTRIVYAPETDPEHLGDMIETHTGKRAKDIIRYRWW